MEETLALIKYQDVEIDQEGTPILEHVNLELHKGEFVFLIGKVGTGKTSLLKTMYSELEIASGEAEVLGNDMMTIKRKNIPQLRRAWASFSKIFSCLQTVLSTRIFAFVLKATGWKDKTEIEEPYYRSAYQWVGMQDKANKMPSELSGGEQQRIVIARAVLNSARYHSGRRTDR
jgi:cell division transport system ATP-binding protein